MQSISTASGAGVGEAAERPCRINLLDLPVEILDLIMKDLFYPDLLSCCLVSRSLLPFAQKVIYGSIDLIELATSDEPARRIRRLRWCPLESRQYRSLDFLAEPDRLRTCLTAGTQHLQLDLSSPALLLAGSLDGLRVLLYDERSSIRELDLLIQCSQLSAILPLLLEAPKLLDINLWLCRDPLPEMHEDTFDDGEEVMRFDEEQPGSDEDAVSESADYAEVIPEQSQNEASAGLEVANSPQEGPSESFNTHLNNEAGNSYDEAESEDNSGDDVAQSQREDTLIPEAHQPSEGGEEDTLDELLNNLPGASSSDEDAVDGEVQDAIDEEIEEDVGRADIRRNLGPLLVQFDLSTRETILFLGEFPFFRSKRKPASSHKIFSIGCHDVWGSVPAFIKWLGAAWSPGEELSMRGSAFNAHAVPQHHESMALFRHLMIRSYRSDLEEVLDWNDEVQERRLERCLAAHDANANELRRLHPLNDLPLKSLNFYGFGRNWMTLIHDLVVQSCWLPETEFHFWLDCTCGGVAHPTASCDSRIFDGHRVLQGLAEMHVGCSSWSIQAIETHLSAHNRIQRLVVEHVLDGEDCFIGIRFLNKERWTEDTE